MIKYMKSKCLELIKYMPIVLFCWMLFIFGPAEIYVMNQEEFEFTFSNYLVCGLLLFIVALIATRFLTKIINRCKVLTIFFVIIDIITYVQILFFNSKMELVGLVPGKPQYSLWTIAVSVLISALIIGVVVFAYKRCAENSRWGKITLFILGVQLFAFCSIIYSIVLIDSKKVILENSQAYYLNGEEQFTISGNKNIIVFVIDYFGVDYLNDMLGQNPDFLEDFNDFTFYTNEDCVYMGTYPSLLHMLTGVDISPQEPISKWVNSAWDNDEVNSFFDRLHEEGYVFNLYTNLPHVIVADCGLGILCDKIDNISNDSYKKNVDYFRLTKCMVKTSAFRMSPYYLKGLFYQPSQAYSGIINSDKDVAHENYDFIDELKYNKGLSVDLNKNYFIVQHINGMHSYDINERGEFSEESTVYKTEEGVMYIVNQYLEELKKNNKYDDSTIIITADHGASNQVGTIFFLKQPYEKHVKVQINSSPISHCEIFPTMMWFVDPELCDEYDERTVFDYNDCENRVRYHYVGTRDEGYPTVPYYNQKINGNYNVYYKWEYDGDIYSLEKRLDEGPNDIVPMKDSLY